MSTKEFFDPIAAVHRLEAVGFPREQAEAIVICRQEFWSAMRNRPSNREGQGADEAHGAAEDA